MVFAAVSVAKVGKWNDTGKSGSKVSYTVCNAAAPNAIYAGLLILA